MTKDDVIAHLHEQTGMPRSGCKKVLNTLLHLIEVELRGGREFALREIGTLKPKEAKARIGRNPATGEQIPIPARKTIAFKISPGLSDRLNP